MTGTSDLTPRQIAVASLVARSWTTKQIALELTISERRVRVIVSSIAYRIGADASLDERVQVAMWWREQVKPTDPNAKAA